MKTIHSLFLPTSEDKGKARAEPSTRPRTWKREPEKEYDVIVLVITKLPSYTPLSLKVKMKMRTPLTRRTRLQNDEDAMEADEDKPQTPYVYTEMRTRSSTME